MEDKASLWGALRVQLGRHMRPKRRCHKRCIAVRASSHQSSEEGKGSSSQGDAARTYATRMTPVRCLLFFADRRGLIPFDRHRRRPPVRSRVPRHLQVNHELRRVYSHSHWPRSQDQCCESLDREYLLNSCTGFSDVFSSPREKQVAHQKRRATNRTTDVIAGPRDVVWPCLVGPTRAVGAWQRGAIAFLARIVANRRHTCRMQQSESWCRLQTLRFVYGGSL